MRKFKEVVNSPDLIILRKEPVNGFLQASLSDPKYKANPMFIVASWNEATEDGGSVEHVSASFNDRRPTIDEMAEVINIFWDESEDVTVFQSTETESANVRFHPYCIHAYRKLESKPVVNPKYQRKNKPLPKNWEENFLQDRNEALLSLNRAKILSYFDKYGVECPDNEEVMWISIHKCRLALEYFPEEAKEVSRKWLLERGYKTTVY